MISNLRHLIYKLKRRFYIKPKKRRSLSVFLKDFFGEECNDFNKVCNEILKNNMNHKIMQDNFKSQGIDYNFSEKTISWHAVVYYLIRKLKPNKLVETGVHHGESTFYILEALRKNGKGSLSSIDYPAYPSAGGYTSLNPFGIEGKDNLILLPEGCDPGWVIPDELKKGWSLSLGKSEDKLVPMLEELGKIDFFLHDSLHSYDNMMFEFQEAFKYMDKGGLIVADNINWNTSFYVFCNENELTPLTYLAYTIDSSLAHPFGAFKK